MNDNEETYQILPVLDAEILAAFQQGRRDMEIDTAKVTELSGGDLSQLNIETEE